MDKVWRWFWAARLLVALAFTIATVMLWDDPEKLVRLIVAVSIWTMWTTDLPTGGEKSGSD